MRSQPAKCAYNNSIITCLHWTWDATNFRWQWWQADKLESYEKSEKKNHCEKWALKRRKFYIILIFNIQSRSRSHLKLFQLFISDNPESASSSNFWNILCWKEGARWKLIGESTGKLENGKREISRERGGKNWEKLYEIQTWVFLWFMLPAPAVVQISFSLAHLLFSSFPLKWSDLNFFHLFVTQFFKCEKFTSRSLALP